MIDPRVFAFEMTVLRDRFGRRDMTDETIARYLDYLGPLMTTEEFKVAAREVFNRDTFWPSPQRFLDAIRGDPKRLAEEAWTAMLEHAKRGEYPALDALPEATRAALKAVPLREIMYADTDIKLARLKREFVDAHQHAVAPSAGPLALPAAPVEPDTDVQGRLLESVGL